MFTSFPRRIREANSGKHALRAGAESSNYENIIFKDRVNSPLKYGRLRPRLDHQEQIITLGASLPLINWTPVSNYLIYRNGGMLSIDQEVTFINILHRGHLVLQTNKSHSLMSRSDHSASIDLIHATNFKIKSTF